MMRMKMRKRRGYDENKDDKDEEDEEDKEEGI